MCELPRRPPSSSMLFDRFTFRFHWPLDLSRTEDRDLPINDKIVPLSRRQWLRGRHLVQMILTYLDSRGDLDTKRLGIFGQGSGGSVAILAAAADPRITAVNVVDPWGDWPDWLKYSTRIPEQERPTYLKPEFLQKVSTLDPAKYLPGMKGRAVRIEQVLDYAANPQAVRDTIARATPDPGGVKRYENIMALNKAWQSTGLSGWLGAQLRQTTSPK